jgi:REP element-mobilizing transposase RayT
MYSSLSNTYFFTATINKWHQLLNTDERKQIILNSLKFMCEEDRIKLFAFVIMPNHIHLILSIEENETKKSIQHSFLKFTAQFLIKYLIYENLTEELSKYRSSLNDRIYNIWKRRPKWIHIDNTIILEQKIDYVHNNPLQERWQLVSAPELYKWSSASFYIYEDMKFRFITDYRDV